MFTKSIRVVRVGNLHTTPNCCVMVYNLNSSWRCNPATAYIDIVTWHNTVFWLANKPKECKNINKFKHALLKKSTVFRSSYRTENSGSTCVKSCKPLLKFGLYKIHSFRVVMVRQAAYEFVEHTWGHGLLFLFPQSALYPASPIQRSIAGIKRSQLGHEWNFIISKR